MRAATAPPRVSLGCEHTVEEKIVWGHSGRDQLQSNSIGREFDFGDTIHRSNSTTTLHGHCCTRHPRYLEAEAPDAQMAGVCCVCVCTEGGTKKDHSPGPGP